MFSVCFVSLQCLSHHIVKGQTLLALFVILAVVHLLAAADEQSVSLAGEWRFVLNRNDAGVKEQWFLRDPSDKIKLPEALQEL